MLYENVTVKRPYEPKVCATVDLLHGHRDVNARVPYSQVMLLSRRPAPAGQCSPTGAAQPAQRTQATVYKKEGLWMYLVEPDGAEHAQGGQALEIGFC